MDKKEIKLTGQGKSEAPEPVGVEGELAGPSRPSSYDCRAALGVGDQAPTQSNVTGRYMELDTDEENQRSSMTGREYEESIGTLEEEKLIGIRRKAKRKDIKRRIKERKICTKDVEDTETIGTGEDRGLSDKLSDESDEDYKNRRKNESKEDYRKRSKEEEKRPNKKRRKNGSPKPGKKKELKNSDLMEKIEKLCTTLRYMDSFTERNKNVHKEMKIWTKEVREEIEYIRLNMINLEKTRNESGKEEAIVEKCRRCGELKNTRDQAVGDDIPFTASKGTQTTLVGDDIGEAKRVMGIEDIQTFEELQKVINKEWSSEIYQYMLDEDEDQVDDSDKDRDEIIFLDSNKANRRIDKLEQEMKDIKELRNSDEIVEIIAKNTSFSINGREKKKEQRIVIVKIKEEDDEIERDKMLFYGIKEAMVRLEGSGERTMKASLPETLDWLRVKKLGKLALRGGEIKIVAKIDKRKGITGESGREWRTVIGRRKQRKEKETQKRNETEAIVVRQEGRTYREVLQRIRGINLEGTEGDLEGIRRTRGGDLLITARKDTGIIGKIKERIKDHIESVDIRKAGEEIKILKIKDLDAVTSKEEVALAIGQAVGEVEEGGIREIHLKPGYGDSQVATVKVAGSLGKSLLKEGSIKIGWSKCGIREWQNIVQCFRCWGFNHTATECAGVNRSKCCRKCGKTGHFKDTCELKDQDFCALCHRFGHNIRTYKCPAYRKAIWDSIKQAEDRRKVLEEK